MTSTPAPPILDHDRHNPYGITGTSFAGTTNAAEALRAGGLDFTVTKEPIATTVLTPDGVTTLPFTDKFATVRHNADGTLGNLGVVGSQYFPIQNAFLASLLQTVADTSNGMFLAAGATHRGARTFVQMGLPEGVMIGGRDGIDLGIVIFNSHDGSGQATGVPTASRIGCTNQFPALRASLTKFTIRHTANGVESWNVEEIRRALTLTFGYARELVVVGTRLLAHPMDAAEFGAFVDDISPVVIHKVTKKELDSSALRRATLKQIFTGAENLTDVRNTRWAAWQTVIEYEDWFRPPVKGSTHEARIVARSTDAIKTRARDLLLA
jgi:phage/plasmid-like protein (TIGR03299 family)